MENENKKLSPLCIMCMVGGGIATVALIIIGAVMLAIRPRDSSDDEPCDAYQSLIDSGLECSFDATYFCSEQITNDLLSCNYVESRHRGVYTKLQNVSSDSYVLGASFLHRFLSGVCAPANTSELGSCCGKLSDTEVEACMIGGRASTTKLFPPGTLSLCIAPSHVHNTSIDQEQCTVSFSELTSYDCSTASDVFHNIAFVPGFDYSHCDLV